MAQKRRKSRSPGPAAPRKHARRSDSVASVDDWAFRVSVISSGTHIDNAIFTKAVHGLVKICFPEGILDELGVALLEKHMRAEKAPEASILKMHDIFRSEMVSRVIWMLAEYLDSPSKIKAGVESIIAASAARHGSKLGGDLLGHIVANLHRSRERLPSDSTRLLADGATIQDPVDGNTNDTSDPEYLSRDNSTSQPRKSKKHKKARERGTMQEIASDQVTIGVQNQVTPSERRVAKNSVSTPAPRANKISSSWRWNVDLEDVLTVDIRDHFTSTADLFAFHALHIAKNKLGILARRKQVRHKIELMLSEMQNTEYEKWVESYEKLLGGDRDMLVRADAVSSTEGRRLIATTPAPVDMRRIEGKEAKNAVNGSKPVNDCSEGPSTRIQDKFPIKCEVNAAASEVAIRPQDQLREVVVTATTAAFRHQLADRHDAEQPLMSSIERTSKADARGSDKGAVQEHGLTMETPIVELLYGPRVIDACNKVEVVHTIMDNLDKRVSMDSIDIPQNNGTIRTDTKTRLFNSLLSVSQGTRDGHIIHPLKVRWAYEKKLCFWVAANPAAFPELHTMPVMFTHNLSGETLVSDLIFDPSRPFPINQAQSDEMISFIVAHLKDRGIFNGPGAQNSVVQMRKRFCRAIRSAARDDESVKRVLMERLLRIVAFHNRRNFPELKDSFVVRTWELMTGQKW